MNKNLEKEICKKGNCDTACVQADEICACNSDKKHSCNICANSSFDDNLNSSFDNNETVAKVFKALCDEKRIAIIKLLQSGEKCACNISDALDLSQSKLSYHMKILCQSGIVECWYVGKWTHYKISENGSANAVSLLKKLTSISEEISDCSCLNK